MRVELHCHSLASDGSDPPAEVARLALERGLGIFALTDHDTCAGSDEAARAFSQAEPPEAAARPPGTFLRAVELSASASGRTVHLLVYDVAHDGRWAAFEVELGQLAQARRARMHQMVARLVQRGIAIRIEDVEAEAAAGAGPGQGAAVLARPHLARALVKIGAVSSVNEAFQRWLGDGGAAVVPMERLSVARALELTRAAGACVSLAHPHTLGPALAAELVRQHGGAGLGAVEAAYGQYGPRERSEWSELARAHGLVITAGSDYHGLHSPDVETVGVDLDDQLAGPLCEWLGLG